MKEKAFFARLQTAAAPAAFGLCLAALSGVLAHSPGALSLDIPASVTVAVFFGLLGGVAVIDAKTTEIPDEFHPLLLAVGVLACFTWSGPALWARLLGLVCVSVPMLVCALCIEGAFGGGDVKLMFACGLALGAKQMLLAFFFAVLLGGLYGIVLLIRRRAGKRDHFAFGPFLCAGMFIAVFWGEGLLSAYLALCGL